MGASYSSSAEDVVEQVENRQLNNRYDRTTLRDKSLTAELLEAGFDPRKNDSPVLDLCCEHGYADTLELLLADSRLDPSYNYNSPIWTACRYGNTRCVELLLADPRVDPRDRRGECLIMAQREGHAEVEKLLLEKLAL